MLADVLRRPKRSSAALHVGMYVGSFTKNTATGNQDITLPSGCPDLTAAAAGSWAIMFSSSQYNAGSSGTWTGSIAAMLGFTTGPSNSYSISSGVQDAQTTTKAGRRVAAKAISIGVWNTGGADEADFVSFPTSTTMRLNWTSQFLALNPTITFIIFTGLSGAKAITWAEPATAVPKLVTGAGFKPDLVFLGTVNTTAAPPSSLTNAEFVFGVMNKHGQQWCNAFSSQDAVGAAKTLRWQQTDSAIAFPYAWGPGVLTEGSFGSMDSDGFTMNYGSVYGSGAANISLCLKGISSKIGAFTRPTATGSSAVTWSNKVSFTPKGALFSSVGGAPLSTYSLYGLWSLGASDLTNERSIAIGDRDAVNPTVAKAIFYSTASIIQANDASSVVGLGTLTATSTSTFTINWTIADSTARETLYLIVGDDGTDTTPVTITQSGGNGTVGIVQPTLDATAYPHQKKGLTLSTGRLVVVEKGTGSAAYFHYSDNGINWNYYGDSAAIAGWSNGSIASYVDAGGIERLIAVWKQTGTGGSRTDTDNYMMVGTFDSARTTLTWGTPLSMSGAGSYGYPDVDAILYSTGGRVLCALSYTNGTVVQAAYYVGAVSSSGVLSLSVGLSLIGGNYTSAGPGTFPSVVIDQTTGRAHAAWSTGASGAGFGVRYRTAAFSTGTWTWATEVEIDNTLSNNDPSYFNLQCRLIPSISKVAVLISDLTAVNPNMKASSFESSNFTTFSEVVLLASADRNSSKRPHSTSFVIDQTTGDIYFFGTPYPMAIDLEYWKWTRATTTTSSPVVVSSVSCPTAAGYYPYSWYSGSKIRFVYTHGNNAPYAVKYDEIPV